MAGLLLCALVCAPLSGCLFPQDDQQVLGQLPPKRNSPISIRAQVPRDPLVSTFFNGTGCLDQNPTFQLTVEDDDLADLVSSLWFIGGTATQPFQPTDIQGGAAVRTVTAPNSLGFKSALANLTANTTETLTVYVADTRFQEVVGGTVALNPRQPRTLPDGTMATDIGSYDSFTWTLKVDSCTP